MFYIGFFFNNTDGQSVRKISNQCIWFRITGGGWYEFTDPECVWRVKDPDKSGSAAGYPLMISFWKDLKPSQILACNLSFVYVTWITVSPNKIWGKKIPHTHTLENVAYRFGSAYDMAQGSRFGFLSDSRGLTFQWVTFKILRTRWCPRRQTKSDLRTVAEKGKTN